MNKISLEEAYKVMQKNCGIEVGDAVKVLRKAADNEMGWSNCWVSEMDYAIGKECEVICTDDDIELNGAGDGCSFPFFVLEKVASKPKPKLVYEIYDSEEDYSDKDENVILLSLVQDDDNNIDLVEVDEDGDIETHIVGITPEGCLARYGGVGDNFQTDDDERIVIKDE